MRMTKEKKTLANHLELRMCASPDYLSIARSAVRWSTGLAEIPDEDADAIVLAVEEALTNVIRHSYGGPSDQPMILILDRIECSQDKTEALEVIVQDFGNQVDPATIKGRDLDDVKPGGLGVHIIRSVMDEIEYTSQPTGGMQLRMLKYLKK